MTVLEHAIERFMLNRIFVCIFVLLRGATDFLFLGVPLFFLPISSKNFNDYFRRIALGCAGMAERAINSCRLGYSLHCTLR